MLRCQKQQRIHHYWKAILQPLLTNAENATSLNATEMVANLNNKEHFKIEGVSHGKADKGGGFLVPNESLI